MFALSIDIRDDHTIANNVYYKAGLVEVIKVRVVDCILLPYVVHQLKPYVYKLKIFAKSPLFVVDTRKTRFKLGATLYKAVSPLDAGRYCATYLKKEIGYIFHPADPRRKSLRI